MKTLILFFVLTSSAFGGAWKSTIGDAYTPIDISNAPYKNMNVVLHVSNNLKKPCGDNRSCSNLKKGIINRCHIFVRKETTMFYLGKELMHCMLDREIYVGKVDVNFHENNDNPYELFDATKIRNDSIFVTISPVNDPTKACNDVRKKRGRPLFKPPLDGCNVFTKNAFFDHYEIFVSKSESPNVLGHELRHTFFDFDHSFILQK